MVFEASMSIPFNGTLTRDRTSRLANPSAQILLAGIGLVLVTFVCSRFGLGVVQAGLAYLIFIVPLALMRNFVGSLALSFIAAGCLVYFFATPLFSFRASSSDDVFAILAFVAISIFVNAIVTWRILPIVSATFAIAIFIVDTITELDVAVSIFYVVVVLVATRFCNQRGVVLVAAGCVYLTMLSATMAHENEAPFNGFVNTFNNILAMVLTTFVVLVQIALRRTQQTYLAEAQQLSHTGSFGWNVSTGKIYWSEMSFRIFGYDSSTKPSIAMLIQRVHPNDVALFQQVIDRAKDQQDFDLEHRLLMPDDSVKHVHVVGHAVGDKPGEVQFMGAVMDITARKEAEKALRDSERRYREVQMELAHAHRIATMGQLTASIAHEVNQPIGAARNDAASGLRFLGRNPPDLDEVREALESIVNSTDRASQIIGRIRAHVKKTPPRVDRFEINEAIRGVAEFTRGEAVKNSVSVRMQLAKDLPLIQGDRIQLQQVVLNLILNAVEAMGPVDHTPRELSISTEPTEADEVLIAVRDSGPGIDSEHLDRVFDSFYTTKPSGMGLGLSICRSIVDAHGGRLWADANEPAGAVFRFTLPAANKDL
jgi:PAS domain S-box-containing protein